MTKISLDVTELTTRQLLLASHRQQARIMAKLEKMEDQMAGLSESVEELKGAVDGVAQRLLPQVEALEAALADSQSKLAEALSDDDEAAAVLAESNAAVAAIRTEVDRLNALGAEPETPVDPEPENPVEPPVVEEPAEPEADGTTGV